MSTRFIRLKVQLNNFKVSDRALSIYAPKLWNQLPYQMKSITKSVAVVDLLSSNHDL